jgi:ADP-dependent NAD(P)H-hydrate dehydratase / NAD(P)H-hydrate epimerase
MLLPADLYTASQVREFEARVIATGLTSARLMQLAGAVALQALRRHWPAAKSIAVVCGAGNNGGDGRVVAQLASQAGMQVRLYEVSGAQPLSASDLKTSEVVVDAVLGIGVTPPLRREAYAAIEAMNASGRPVFSLDIPSGLHPDTGRGLPAVRAAATITFVALKQGLFLDEGPECCGKLYFDDLGVSATDLVAPEPQLRRITQLDLQRALPARPRRSHKGLFGRVLVIGGGAGMPGAVRLAAESALRSGAGLVTVASVPEHLAAVTGTRPELMFHAITNKTCVAQAMEGADVVAVGPGLGRSDWARGVLQGVFLARKASQILVIDADALNLMSQGEGPVRCDDWVLTPHPGEAARLLGCTSEEVQADRLSGLRRLCEQRGGVVVLKGASTLVGQQGRTPMLCDLGNAGMSVAGMGDVLTGAIAGLIAQRPHSFDAAVAAVFAHASAGDLCARSGVRGILASDVGQSLRTVLSACP